METPVELSSLWPKPRRQNQGGPDYRQGRKRFIVEPHPDENPYQWGNKGNQRHHHRPGAVVQPVISNKCDHRAQSGQVDY